MENKQKNDKPGMIEKFSLTFRKKLIVNKITTFLIIAVLIAGFICINIWVDDFDLPKIDVTENKVYTLSEASKNVIKDIEQDIKIYVYGYEDNSSLIDFIKQYIKTNEKISYEILTDESNYNLVKEYGLTEGYSVLIIESGDSKKVIDAQNDFYSYDYVTGQSVDLTEQAITNAILGILVENKPKVYFLTGHGEYNVSETTVLTTYLTNESFEVNTLNILTNGGVPEDCDVLAILSPSSDLLESEVDALKNYINNGGNIFFTIDVITEDTKLTNLKSILDLYGFKVENGYVVEKDNDYVYSGHPYIFIPQITPDSNITKDIYTDSYLMLVYATRLQFLPEEELTALGVTQEELLSSSDKSVFVNDISANMSEAAATLPAEKSIIASLITKTISNNEDESIEDIVSKMVAVSTGNFITDYTVSAVSDQYPLSYIASNKDFVINSIAELAEKEGGLSIRKDMSSSTYTPTETDNRIVLTIIFSFPVIIIFIGIIVWGSRRKRK